MNVPEVSCSEAIAMRDAGAVWIDVREVEEWNHAHIEDTALIPLRAAVVDLPIRHPDRATQIVISCLSGARSGQLVGMLRQAGYSDVHNLRGGLQAWAREGRPMVVGA